MQPNKNELKSLETFIQAGAHLRNFKKVLDNATPKKLKKLEPLLADYVIRERNAREAYGHAVEAYQKRAKRAARV